ncbi:MAG TPA: GFA family protein [Sphingobium sp.]
MTDGATRTGGCLCGAVRYSAPGTPLAVATCHCRDCQKQAGSAFSLLAIFPRDAVIFEGELALFSGRGDSGNAIERRFCRACGSPISSDSDAMRERGVIVIKAGTLDDVSDLQPAIHYWTRSRQDWFALPTDVPQRDTV